MAVIHRVLVRLNCRNMALTSRSLLNASKADAALVFDTKSLRADNRERLKSTSHLSSVAGRTGVDLVQIADCQLAPNDELGTV
jgi:hypothetical protein